jgi:hypothetical protein
MEITACIMVSRGPCLRRAVLGELSKHRLPFRCAVPVVRVRRQQGPSQGFSALVPAPAPVSGAGTVPIDVKTGPSRFSTQQDHGSQSHTRPFGA